MEPERKRELRKNGKRIVIICLASVLMAVNINTFVHAGGLYPGGATGLTVLIQRVFKTYLDMSVPYTLINLCVNAVPVYIGFRYIGRRFTLYSFLMILVTNVMTDLLPYYTITYDPLLVAIFGGLINGFVIAVCLTENATSGGTDFIAIYLSEKKGVDSFNYILGLNAVLLAVAGLLYGWDKALYSIIFQFMSTQVIHVMYKRYRQNTILIITSRADEICEKIYEISRHGATIMKGIGAYEKTEREVVYSVISTAHKDQVVRAVRQIDPDAFVNVIKTDQVNGWFYYEEQD